MADVIIKLETPAKPEKEIVADLRARTETKLAEVGALLGASRVTARRERPYVRRRHESAVIILLPIIRIERFVDPSKPKRPRRRTK